MALPLANAYRARNHEVAFAVKDIAAAGTIIPATVIPCIKRRYGTRLRILRAPPRQLCGNIACLRFWQSRHSSQHGASMDEPVPACEAGSARARLFANGDARGANCRGASLHDRPRIFLPPRLTPVPAFIPEVDQERLCRSEEFCNAINQVRLRNAARRRCLALPISSTPTSIY